MRKMFLAVALMAGFALMTTARAQDLKATLEAATKAMGAVYTAEYSGTGTNAAFGQAYAPGGAWATFKVTDYNAVVNLTDNSMRVQMERTNPVGPARGGGGLPLFGPGNPQLVNQALNNRTAWNVNANAAPGTDPNIPQQAALTARLLDFWTGPHAVLSAAEANNATVNGRVLSFKMFSTPVTVTLGPDNLVSKVEYTTDTPVLGDTPTEITYTLYKTFGPAKFPTHITSKQGGLPILDLTINKVTINGIVKAVTVPASVQSAFAANPPPPRNAPPAPVPQRVTTTKVADGVYYLTGGTHHSMAVEMKDYVVLFEAPVNEDRTTAVIEEVKKTVPNKPIRYLVNSHHHFDHLGGIRAAMAEGLTILTQGAATKAYYEKLATMPHTILPDRLAKSPKAPMVEAVLEKKILMDETRTLEIIHIPTDHASTMLVGYLPKEKILYEVDLFNAPAANAPAPTAFSPSTAGFYDQLVRMKLDVQQILPGHGPGTATMAQLKTFAGKNTTAAH